MLEAKIALLNLYKQLLDFAHWQSGGRAYNHHLLFDRLRKEIQSQTDLYVERQLHDKSLNFFEYKKVEADLLNAFEYGGIVQKSMICEIAKTLYEKFTSDEELDDDMINLLKQHIYLLKD